MCPFEFPFIESDASDLQGEELLAYLKARWPRLSANVKKLLRAGWSVRPTMSGLAMTPSPELCTEEVLDTYETIEDYLNALGIDEEINHLPTRTLLEVLDAEEECWERIAWDTRSANRAVANPNPKVIPFVTTDWQHCQQCIEERYGRDSLTLADDYERGVLHGRVATLRWVRGDTGKPLLAKRPSICWRVYCDPGDEEFPAGFGLLRVRAEYEVAACEPILQ
jgi:hypothetical protein